MKNAEDAITDKINMSVRRNTFVHAGTLGKT